MKKSFSQYVRVGSLGENGIVRFRIDWTDLKEGKVGIIGRSGTLGYEAAQQLKNLDIGVSTSVGI